MDKNFIKRAIMLPAIITIILAIVMFAFLKVNTDFYIPVNNGIEFAYHEKFVKSVEFEQKDSEVDLSTLKKNDCIGAVKTDYGFSIRYDSDYVNLKTSLSFVPNSTPFGETGFTYLKASNANAKKLKAAKTVTIESIYGKHTYRYDKERSFKNEYKVLTYAPNTSSAVIIYYRDSNGIGFTSDYKALVFKEVKS